MKTISLSVSEKDYEVFRAEAKRTDKSIAALIREAMTDYRDRSLLSAARLDRVHVFEGAAWRVASAAAKDPAKSQARKSKGK